MTGNVIDGHGYLPIKIAFLIFASPTDSIIISKVIGISIRTTIRLVWREMNEQMKAERDIQNYWGSDLVQIPKSVLSDFTLPDETCHFLETVGLPLDKNLGRYYLYLGIEFAPSSFHLITYQEQKYGVIGKIKPIHDLPVRTIVNICLAKTGEVNLIMTKTQYKPDFRFVNTNIRYLLLFLMICLHHMPRKKSEGRDNILDPNLMPRKEYDKILSTIRQKFLGIDPQALSEPEHYWSSVLFDWSI